MSGTGRLIAAASSRLSRVKAFVHQLASDAVSRVQRWRREAGDSNRTSDVELYMVNSLWSSVQEAYREAMDAVQHGYSLQSVSATVEFMRFNLRLFDSLFARGWPVAMWERTVVRGTHPPFLYDLHRTVL